MTEISGVRFARDHLVVTGKPARVDRLSIADTQSHRLRTSRGLSCASFANQRSRHCADDNLDRRFDPEERRHIECTILRSRGRPEEYEVDVLDSRTRRHGRLRESEIAAAIFAGRHTELLPSPARTSSLIEPSGRTSASPLWRSSRPTIRSYRLRARIFGRASVADRGEAAEAAPSPPLA
jgi:hypothetical protein